MIVKDMLGESWAAKLPKAEKLLEDIRKTLNDDKRAGITIYPAKKNIFRVFRETPFEQVKVVWLGQDPYHSPENQATGLTI